MGSIEATLTQKVNAVLSELTTDISSNKLQLPSPPDLLIKVRAIISDEDSSLEDLVDLVKLDSNISGRLIKVSNSALLGSRVHVTDVKSAITRLGSSKVQSLITSLIITQNFIKYKVHILEDYFNQTWQQSNNVAAISYVLAAKKTKLDPEQALLAGMVHNMGILPLMLRLNKIPLLENDPELLKKVASVVIPKLYPSAGKLILDNWNFSPAIAQVSLTHNNLQRESTGKINLNDITLIAYELSKLSDITDAEIIPESFTASVTFKKLWNDWSEATEELTKLHDEINEIKNGITN